MCLQPNIIILLDAQLNRFITMFLAQKIDGCFYKDED